MDTIRSSTRTLLALLALTVATASAVAQDTLSGVWLTSSGDVLLLTENDFASGGFLIGQSMGVEGVDGTVEDGRFSFRAPGVAIEGEHNGSWIEGRFTRSDDESGGPVDFEFSAYRPVGLSSSSLDGVWCVEDELTGRESYYIAYTTELFGIKRTRVIEIEINEGGQPIGGDVYLGSVQERSGLFFVYSSRGAIAGQLSDGVVLGVKMSWVGEESTFIGSRKFH